MFVTIEDETGDVQLILWAKVFARRRRELGSLVILVRGVVSRWDGTTNIVVSDVQRVDTGVSNARRPRLALKRDKAVKADDSICRSDKQIALGRDNPREYRRDSSQRQKRLNQHCDREGEYGAGRIEASETLDAVVGPTGEY